MSAGSGSQSSGIFARLAKQRRKRIKKFGKNFIRGMSGFVASQSRVGDVPVYDNADFPFVKLLEENWQVIRAELDEILKHRHAIPSFVELSQDQKRIASDERWKTFLLYGFGKPMESNCSHAPKTAELLSRVPSLQTAFFSILGPNYHVPTHRGVSKSIMRSHIALIVPKDRENCTIRIADQTVAWEEGKGFVFDDTYDHEVWNNTNEDRVVLLFDFDRPMRFWGRLLHRVFVAGLRMTAYYREPKRKMPGFGDRFDAAVRRSQDFLEGS